MGTEYDDALEEQIESLEAENEVLGLEVDRLTEKMDELDAVLNRKHAADYKQKLSRVANELMKELGVVKCSTDDPEMIIAMARKKINELRWNQPTEAAPMKGMVRIALRDNVREPSYYEDLYMNKTQPWERYMDPREERVQYYQLTVEELAKDHMAMMDAVKELARLYAKSMRSPNYHGDREQEEKVLEFICEKHKLKVLPHNKRMR